MIISVILLNSCNSNEVTYGNHTSDVLRIEKIKDNVYRHTSYLRTETYGKVPCNGLIYINGNEAIIFDTPTDNMASTELIEWIGKKDIKAVVVTHFHEDCLGGLEEFHKKGIPSFASKRTIELAKRNNHVAPKSGFDIRKEFKIDGMNVYAEFFGEGHTRDNVVGYIPSEKVLFGGCLIKAIKAGKGNLADANTADWATTVQKIKNDIKDIEIVVPGHGQHGGLGILDYTIELFSEN
ncbi:subclass B1 metallo-beta-lactamase [Galbibacter mesophilus]|nr:subclass B1 metallo-beta-lactamase [Galbibacter mesophilus]MCM5663643.1 subclass B1 metallo-beta-lactamase [Galbibacter mesophilus]